MPTVELPDRRRSENEKSLEMWATLEQSAVVDLPERQPDEGPVKQSLEMRVETSPVESVSVSSPSRSPSPEVTEAPGALRRVLEFCSFGARECVAQGLWVPNASPSCVLRSLRHYPKRQKCTRTRSKYALKHN